MVAALLPIPVLTEEACPSRSRSRRPEYRKCF
jgi:hypothetical protein